MILRHVLSFVTVALSIACSSARSARLANDYWPDASWRTSTPESQGVASGALISLLDHVANNGVRLHHLSIIRNGYLILNADVYPYQQDSPHDIVSGTKCVTSTLIGIAEREGLVNLDARVGSFFPAAASHTDSRAREMTVRDLLTMTSGLCDGFDDNARQLEAMRRSAAGAEILLQEPLRSEPGTAFAYCDGASQLLSAILTQATKMPAHAYAKNRLYDPLNIGDVIWPRDPRGDNSGWGDSFIRPLDFARIGYLYLRNGMWKGRRILSEDWIRQATTGHVATPGGERYGYQWWVPREGMYEARGRGGQRLIVWPEQDLVIVMLGAGFDPAEIGRFIVAALNGALPEASETRRQLEERIATVARQRAPDSARPIPVLSHSVSGRIYRFEPNDVGLEWFRLTFGSADEGRIELSLADQYHEQRGLRSSLMGLDGAFRISATGRFDLPIAVRGQWRDERTFAIVYDEIANTHVYDIWIEFDGNSATWQMSDRTAPFSMTLLARAQAGE